MSETKRKRRLLRPRNIVLSILVLIVLVVGWLGWEVWSVYTDEPAITIDTRAELSALAASHQPPGANGWSALVDAIEGLNPTLAEGGYAVGYNARPRLDTQRLLLDLSGTESDFAAEEHAALALLEERGYFGTLERALAYPNHVRPWSGEGPTIGETLPENEFFRPLAHFLAGRMRAAATRGDWAAVEQTFAMALRFGQVIAAQPIIVNWMSGESAQRTAFAEVRHMLREHEVPRSTVHALREALEAHPLPALDHAVDGERLGVHDAVQWSHGSRGYALPLPALTDYGAYGGLIFTPDWWEENEPRSFAAAVLARTVFATRQENDDLVDRWYEAFVARTAQPFAERWANWPPSELDAALEDPAHAVVTQYISELRRVVDMRDDLEVHRRTTLLMLAVEQHIADKGEPPASLDALVPTYLDALPSDPLHGGPFGYRVLTDDPHGRPFLLYSFGADGEDNRGAEDPDHPGYALSRRAASIDYILNPPRDSAEADESRDGTAD